MATKRRPILTTRLTQEELAQWRVLRRLYKDSYKTDAALLRYLIRENFRVLLSQTQTLE